MKLNNHTYATLSSKERLNLAIKALANDDLTKLDSLKNSCPLGLENCPQPVYIIQLQAALFAALVFTNECILLHGKLELIDALMLTHQVATTHPHYTDITVAYSADTLHADKVNYLTKLKAAVEGFKAFCAETTLSFSDLVNLCQFNKNCTRLEEYLMQGEEPSPAAITQAKTIYTQLWDGYCTRLNLGSPKKDYSIN